MLKRGSTPSFYVLWFLRRAPRRHDRARDADLRGAGAFGHAIRVRATRRVRSGEDACRAEIESVVRPRGKWLLDESADSVRDWSDRHSLDSGKFELPKATPAVDQHVVVSDAIFEVHGEVFAGRSWSWSATWGASDSAVLSCNVSGARTSCQGASGPVLQAVAVHGGMVNEQSGAASSSGLSLARVALQ